MRRRTCIFAGLVVTVSSTSGLGQDAPTFTLREQALKSIVYVRATNCADATERAGSGFALNSPATVVTAHHVVGGCNSIRVTYGGVPQSQSRVRHATLARVLAWGDLALLEVANPPAVPSLTVADPPHDKSKTHAGLGYQNNQPSAGDVAVTFSPGSAYLKDIIPNGIRKELHQAGTALDFDQQVLRFNSHLQPGMSGGPIIDPAGRVVGIVAGGLKAGAAPASWGWPSEWISRLVASREAPSAVQIANIFYTYQDLQAARSAEQSRRVHTCGLLTFAFRGSKRFSDIALTADDQPRLAHIVKISGLPRTDIDLLEFDTWVHAESGATAVMPKGYPVTMDGNVCTVRSSTGPFIQAIWSAPATDQMQVQQVSTLFEVNVVQRLAPFLYGFDIDVALTTMGPQLRDQGMIFNRKGFSYPKAPWMNPWQSPPMAHIFETLIAKKGSFLGVGTVNNEVFPNIQSCIHGGNDAPGCDGARRHQTAWTHFILATQLSTYPVY